MPKITNHIKPVRTRFVKVLTHAISIGKAKSVAEIARQLKVNGSHYTNKLN